MDKSAEAFRTISEAAEELHVPQHVLRFWETRFSHIKPMKRAGGRRYYRPEDMALLHAICHLLYGEGYTIRGVQRLLKEQGVRAVIAMPEMMASSQPQTRTAGVPVISIDGDERTHVVMQARADQPPVHREPRFDIVPDASVERELSAADHDHFMHHDDYDDDTDSDAEPDADDARDANAHRPATYVQGETAPTFAHLAPGAIPRFAQPLHAPVQGLSGTQIEQLHGILADLEECERILLRAQQHLDPTSSID